MSSSDLCIYRNDTAGPRHFQNRITYKVQSPNSHIHVSVSDLYIPRIGLPILMQPSRQNDPGNMYITHMNVGIGNEAAQFHFWETLIGFSVQCRERAQHRNKMQRNS